MVFSFIWPHVKLFLLHLAFFLPISPSARRNANYWLAFFGKWTLCDVLVMCALIGMFNIQAEMDVLKLWDELKPDFVHLCDGICAGNGSRPLGGANCTELCEEAEAALSTTLLNDATLPSSDLAFAVSMRGLTSMYLFCCAVVLSLSLGVAIEFLDDRQRAAAAAAAAAATAERAAAGVAYGGRAGAVIDVVARRRRRHAEAAGDGRAEGAGGAGGGGAPRDASGGRRGGGSPRAAVQTERAGSSAHGRRATGRHVLAPPPPPRRARRPVAVDVVGYPAYRLPSLRSAAHGDDERERGRLALGRAVERTHVTLFAST